MGRLLKAAEIARATPALAVAAAVAPPDRAAYDDGYQAGLAAGREAGLSQVTELLAAARADAEAIRQRARDAAVVLARRMAEKIVGHAVEVTPAVMGDIVTQALAASRARAGVVVVRVHPEDLAAVEAARARWAAGPLVVQTVADAAVGRHGCVVETPAGRVDARLDAQLAALERALARPRGGEP
jgi:flagellar biosynthesis/type III secretory pathway protein FliH